jgi:hypothetical protein
MSESSKWSKKFYEIGQQNDEVVADLTSIKLLKDEVPIL